MLSVLALFAMGVAPGHQSLVDDTPREAYPRVLRAQSQLPETPPSLAQLRAEQVALQEAMPSQGGPISALIAGGVLTLGGFIVAFIGLTLGLVGGPAWVLLGGLIAMAAGVAMLVAGFVLLSRTNRERQAIAKDLETVRQEIRALESPAPPTAPTLPLPAPPPQVAAPSSSLLLAQF